MTATDYETLAYDSTTGTFFDPASGADLADQLAAKTRAQEILDAGGVVTGLNDGTPQYDGSLVLGGSSGRPPADDASSDPDYENWGGPLPDNLPNRQVADVVTTQQGGNLMPYLILAGVIYLAVR
jgi:hypothetical protein